MMRRKEFDVQEEYEEDIIDFMNEMSYGFLALQGDHPYASIVPINYIYYNDAIYFHGSRIGEKMKTLKMQNHVTFAIAKEFAIIPSYMNDPFFACPATAFFKSVIVYGKATVIEDIEEKCDVLSAFMKKLQPEGGYAPISSDNKEYVSRVKATAIVRIDIDKLSAKFKFGQNWKNDKVEHVRDQLENRGQVLDHDTSLLMERYCPHNKKQ